MRSLRRRVLRRSLPCSLKDSWAAWRRTVSWRAAASPPSFQISGFISSPRHSSHSRWRKSGRVDTYAPDAPTAKVKRTSS
jgi:hypothetical protein